MEEGHRAGADTTSEAVAHDEVVARAQPLEEHVHRREVIGEIGVTHEHIASARRPYAAGERGTVSPDRRADDARAGTLRDLPRSIGTAVVRDDDLARDAVRTQRF